MICFTIEGTTGRKKLRMEERSMSTFTIYGTGNQGIEDVLT